MLELFLLFVGLRALISGSFPTGGGREATGAGARIAGLILTLPLPVTVVVFWQGIDEALSQDISFFLYWREKLVWLELGMVFGCGLLGYMLAAIVASSQSSPSSEMSYRTQGRSDINLPKSDDRSTPRVRKGTRRPPRRERRNEEIEDPEEVVEDPEEVGSPTRPLRQLPVDRGTDFVGRARSPKGRPAEPRLNRAREYREPKRPRYFWPLVGGLGLAGLLLVILLIVVLVGRKDPQSAGEPRPSRLVKEPPPATDFPGVLGYWSFDEGQGTQAKDASGHGEHGVVHGSHWVRGVRGKALQFQTQDDYFDYGASSRFNFPARSPFSFAGWIQTGASTGTILAQRNRADGGPVISVYLGGGRLQALVREDGGEFGHAATVTGPLVNDNEWHHFVLIRQASGAIELYVDGQLQGSGSGSHAGGAITTNFRTIAREQFWLSVRRIAGDPYWNGCIDEFALFNRALSAEEIKNLGGQGP